MKVSSQYLFKCIAVYSVRLLIYFKYKIWDDINFKSVYLYEILKNKHEFGWIQLWNGFKVVFKGSRNEKTWTTIRRLLLLLRKFPLFPMDLNTGFALYHTFITNHYDVYIRSINNISGNPVVTLISTTKTYLHKTNQWKILLFLLINCFVQTILITPTELFEHDTYNTLLYLTASLRVKLVVLNLFQFLNPSDKLLAVLI